jgi:hypothetical protein
MPRAPHVPPELTKGPFTVTEALRAGLTRRQLQGRSWKRLATGLYVWTGLGDDPITALSALSTRLPPGAAFLGSHGCLAPRPGYGALPADRGDRT